MLSKKNRLKKKKDFERVFKKGRGFKQGFLYLKILENNLKESRLGFVVGKNVSKRAVDRNKIKRRLSEVVRLKIPGLKKAIDAVIVVLAESGEYDFKNLESGLNNLFKKAGLIKK